MKNTKILSFSIGNDIIEEFNKIDNNKYKFRSDSHKVSYFIKLGIKNFKEGQRLVNFVDRIFGE